VLVVAFVMSALPASAQVGRVGGTIKDGQGQPIKGATVLAENPSASPSSFTATTDDKGRYSIIGLKAGPWKITASAPGFQPSSGQVPIRTVGAPMPPVDFVLAPGAAGPAGALAGVNTKELQAELAKAEEMVNAQQYDDPAPSVRRGGDFALFAEGAPAPFYPGERTRLLRFAVKAREIDAHDRKPAVLTFVVDVSGSMDQENRLGLVKRALGLLLDELGPEDRVGLVVYGTNGRVLLRHTRDLEEIRGAIAELRPEGSTNVEEGLRLAYDLADEGWRQGASNRILLCSDGVANVGATGPESILARIGQEAQRGIALTTVGFGMGNYNDALMEQLADQGDGTYHYVDALAEARKVFVENLTGTLETVAKEAKAQVEFNPRSVVRWRLLGYENRDVADRDFRNDRIDAGELGAGHQATALYEVRLRDGVAGSERVATLRLRWKSVATKQVEEVSRDLRAGDLERDWADAPADFHLAALAGAFAEKLKETAAADDFGWRSLRRESARLEDEGRRNRSAEDLGAAIRRAAEIAGVRGDDRDDPNDRDDRRRRDDDDRPRNPRLEED
jgi:Ca-activated chloride channel family protein